MVTLLFNVITRCIDKSASHMDIKTLPLYKIREEFRQVNTELGNNKTTIVMFINKFALNFLLFLVACFTEDQQFGIILWLRICRKYQANQILNNSNFLVRVFAV